MLRYQLAAAALKAFSLNAWTRKAYRSFGNVMGARKRSREIKPNYLQRAHGNLKFIEDHGGIADGMRVLEIGTGWVHWEALFTRMFYDVRVVLFDVWDNRQFPGLLHYAQTLRNRMRAEIDRPAEAIDRAEALLDKVLACRDFPEVYALLGFEYMIDPSGSLAAIPDGSLDLAISSDVLEHVPRDAVPGLARDLFRVLKPGGRNSAQIVFNDHLCIYDRKVHVKNLLRYTDATWKLLYENDVQYVNRLQPSDFRKAFRDAGLVVEDEIVVDRCDITGMRIAAPFAHYPREELETSVNRILVRKPD